MSDLIIIVGLILLNGVFSMSEVALISARKSRLAYEAKRGNGKAKAALSLAEDPDRFLSTVQIGITLIGILTGLFSGASFSEDLADVLCAAGMRRSVAGFMAKTLIVIVVTYLSIVVGELFPKRIGLNASDKVAMMVGRPMRLLSSVALPAVWLLSKSTSLLVKVFGLDKGKESVTEEEIKSVIREGTSAGEVRNLEQDIMIRALVMGDEKVSSIMTPKVDITALDTGMSCKEIKDVLRAETHSLYPVFDEERENVIGVVYLKDLIFEICSDSFSLSALVKPGSFIPESMLVYDVLDILKQRGVHCCLVCNEFGDMQGMVTLCDVLGGLVGSVEVGTDDPFVTPRADGESWLVEGQCPIYDFLSYFDLEDDYVPKGYSTVAGLVLDSLKKIPKEGESLTYETLTLEIVDMDGPRIDKLLVKRVRPDTE